MESADEEPDSGGGHVVVEFIDSLDHGLIFSGGVVRIGVVDGNQESHGSIFGWSVEFFHFQLIVEPGWYRVLEEGRNGVFPKRNHAPGYG